MNIYLPVVFNRRLLVREGVSMDVNEKRLSRDRILFYSGLVLLLAGLPGFMLGSWLHDLLRVPVIGDAYTAWGWINQMFAFAGLLVAVAGCLLLGLSLRGGAVSAPKATKGCEET